MPLRKSPEALPDGDLRTVVQMLQLPRGQNPEGIGGMFCIQNEQLILYLSDHILFVGSGSLSLMTGYSPFFRFFPGDSSSCTVAPISTHYKVSIYYPHSSVNTGLPVFIRLCGPSHRSVSKIIHAKTRSADGILHNGRKLFLYSSFLARYTIF